jgi:hypothetical protein
MMDASVRPISKAKEEMFTDLLAAVAKSLTNSTSHLPLEAGVHQSSVLQTLQKQKWNPRTIRMHQYLNEDNPDCDSNFTNWLMKCCKKIQI